MYRVIYATFPTRGILLGRSNKLQIRDGFYQYSAASSLFPRKKENFRNQPTIVYSSNDSLYKHHSYFAHDSLFILERYLYKTSPIIIARRHIHIYPSLNDKDTKKPSSQVEVTVNDLKEKAKLPTDGLRVTETVSRKSLATRIKDEILHYYHGFKLLFIDVRIASKYCYRILNGDSLSRREHRQLIRTTGDLFRLLPFSVFIIIPFMEFLLPVALKLFPGMLPSTFETSNEKEAKMKKKLKVKLEMAKFLQKTLDSLSVEGKGHHSESAKEFVEFFEKTHRTGEYISNKDILKFSKLFEDEITLDSLSRPQLIAVCRLLEMQPFGTNNFLRFQLRLKLRSLAADDKIIQREGIKSLAVWELQQACRTRGMRAFGLSKERLEMQLKQWLDLSLNEMVPPSLLLLSRTLFVPNNVPQEETLAATISTLPDEVATLTKASIGKKEGKLDNVTRFEIIQSEEKKIKEDNEEEMEEKKRKVELSRKKEEQAMQLAVEESMEEVLSAKAASGDFDAPTISKLVADMAAVQGVVDKETLRDEAPTKVDKAAEVEDPTEQEFTAEDIDHMEEALEMIEIKKKSHFIEENELSELKTELADYQEDIKDFKEVLEESGDKKAMKESKAAKRLFGRVDKMIKRMDPLMDALNKEKETIQKRIEEQEGGTSSEKKAEVINIEELIGHLRTIVSATDSAKIENIKAVLAKMDDDLDGAVKVEHVLKVLKLISEDEVNMSTKLFEEIIEIMAKEDQLETESLVEFALQVPLKSHSENSEERVEEGQESEIDNKISDLTAKKNSSKHLKPEK